MMHERFDTIDHVVMHNVYLQWRGALYVYVCVCVCVCVYAAVLLKSFRGDWVTQKSKEETFAFTFVDREKKREE